MCLGKKTPIGSLKHVDHYTKNVDNYTKNVDTVTILKHVDNYTKTCAGGLNSHWFPVVGDSHFSPIVGVYIPIVRIPY